MKIYAERDDYKCVLLEPDDWYLMHLSLKNEVMTLNAPSEVLEEDELSEEYCRSEIMDTREDFLVLLNPKNEPIGHCRMLRYTKLPAYTDAFILEKFRGQKLSDLLIQAACIRASETTHLFTIQCLIHENNLPSRKAVERNGFMPKNLESVEGTFIRFERLLSDYRPKTQIAIDLCTPSL
jgi:RimJ/RimL family protein N-acetyltransferase